MFGHDGVEMFLIPLCKFAGFVFVNAMPGIFASKLHEMFIGTSACQTKAQCTSEFKIKIDWYYISRRFTYVASPAEDPMLQTVLNYSVDLDAY